jgi:hypothetical protein
MWVLRKDEERRIRVSEMRFLREIKIKKLTIPLNAKQTVCLKWTNYIERMKDTKMKQL